MARIRENHTQDRGYDVDKEKGGRDKTIDRLNVTLLKYTVRSFPLFYVSVLRSLLQRGKTIITDVPNLGDPRRKWKTKKRESGPVDP